MKFIRKYKEILVILSCCLIIGLCVGSMLRSIYDLGRREAYLKGYLQGSQHVIFTDQEIERNMVMDSEMESDEEP